MKKIVIGLSLLICLNFASNASAEYYVQSGDTMSKIAQNYGMKLRDLISLNPQHPNPAEIHVGDFMVVREKSKAKVNLVEYARSLQDITAYQYGGNNFPYEVDCSAWTQGVFRKFGQDLPRTSADQSKTGAAIPFKDLNVGDLMFFSTRPDKKVTHVGIFMGNGYWISNLNAKSNVKILSTWGKWTQENFLWGTRYKL